MVVDTRGASPGTHVLSDVRALFSPRSLLYVKHAVRGLAPGTVVTVRRADPWVALDVAAWACMHGVAVIAERPSSESYGPV